MNSSFSGPAQGDKHMVCGNVSGLPARIQKILCRFGVLLGEPEVFGGACGGDVTAIACFQTLEAAEAGGSQRASTNIFSALLSYDAQCIWVVEPCAKVNTCNYVITN